MGKVIVHFVMSLDGYISKPDEMDIAWMFRYGSDDDEMALRTMNEIGAVVLGNKGFRDGTMSEKYLPYGGHHPSQFVVTHHAREPMTIGPVTFTFVTGGVEQAIALAREAAGDKAVVLLSASIAQQGLKAGLVDEIVIHLLPILLGDGVLLFDHLGQEVELRREEVATTSQETSLRFSVVRDLPAV
jgi:dihydrofolate reductase